MPHHLEKKIKLTICPILTSKKIGLVFLNPQDPSKKPSIHYNISLYPSPPNSRLNLWLFIFPFSSGHLFSQKASQLFNEYNICFLTHANDDVCIMVSSYFQSDCSQLANSTLLPQLPVL